MISGQNFIIDSTYKFLISDQRFIKVRETLTPDHLKLIKEFIGNYSVFEELTERTKVSNFRMMETSYRQKTLSDQHIYREKLADIAIQLTPYLLAFEENRE